jgi:hypothetical protein
MNNVKRTVTDRKKHHRANRPTHASLKAVGGPRIHSRIGLLALLVSCFSLLAVGQASAATPPLLTQFPKDKVSGSGAGQLNFSFGVAGSPVLPGDIYVADGSNNRIDQFTPWGGFIAAWGWGVKNGNAEFEKCTTESRCQAGIEGSGPGQLTFPGAIAIDSSGDVYVHDENFRIQKFDSSGNFILMFGANVNATKVAESGSTQTERNICTAISGDACQAGTSGTGQGELESSAILAVDQAHNSVLIGGGERIQKFDENGNYLETIALPEGKKLRALAADSSGNLYVEFQGETETQVRKLKSTGPTAEFLTPIFEVGRPLAGGLAVDPTGNLYVPVATRIISNERQPEAVFEFNATGNCLSCGGDGEGGKPGFDTGFVNPDGSELLGIGVGSGCGPADVYVTHFDPQVNPAFAYVNAFGPPPNPALCPPPSVPPEIGAQFATSTDSFGAILKAQINPNFWLDTTYYVEYGTGKCSEGGCDKQRPVPPGARLTSATTNQFVTTPAVTLTGLEPGTEYHYRFVATSSGGGPVRGVSGEVGKDGAEATFTTAPSSSEPKTNCPNQTFRIGASATLPDCRAYEMVSPVDKNGGNVASNPETQSYGPLAESAADGSRATFSSLRAFADPSSAPLLSQYLSSRGPDGWSTQSISPPRASFMRGGGIASNGRFNAFSEDLCNTWVFADSSLPLVPEAPAGYSNLYRRDNCASEPSYELLSNAIPFGIEPEAEIEGDILTAQGFSADHSHTVFLGTSGNESVASGLTKDACSKEPSMQLYESNPEGGPLRLVSTLPNGKAACGTASAGTGAEFNSGFQIFSSVSADAHNAISPDGSRVFWTKLERINDEGIAVPVGLFLRTNATQPQSKVSSGKCTEPEKACTVAVAEGFSEGKEPRYWDANPETTKALYTVGSLGQGAKLFEYDVEMGTSQLLAEGVNGLAGSSEDLSRIYFTSKQALSSEPNSEGDEAQDGKSNLYIEEDGTVTFIATLGGGGASSPANFNPHRRTSRVSPDGLHLAFTAATRPTGYDNADAVSGEPDTEVFLYDASPSGGPGQLVCVSCNPSGGRPSGRLVEEFEGGIRLWAAAELPGWAEIRRPSRLLSVNGNRLFFQTYDSLVPGDSNGKRDVYEWERASSSQACQEAGAGRYVLSAGGCLSLITSGQSATDSELIDASTDGADVFFKTSASLLPQDPGLVDVYDARVDGGFPQPIKTAACEGEACQGPLTPPNDPTPGSSTFNGAGNVTQAKAKKAHKKKHAKKHSKKQQKHKKQNAKQRANDKRRAGR